MRSFFRVAVSTVAFAALHSVLASRRVKARVYDRIPGARAVYRLAYNVQAVGTFALLVWLVSREPKVTLYRVTGLSAVLLRGGQIAGVALAVMAARATGVAKLAGLDTLPLPGTAPPDHLLVPVAQGPELGDDGRLRVRGPFRAVRHPLNVAPLAPFWLTPHMTSRRLAFNLIASMYLLLGSVHEEARLAEEYGREYEQYRRSGVPFYLPVRARATFTGGSHDQGCHSVQR